MGRLRAKRDRHSTGAQFPGCPIELEITEPEGRPIFCHSGPRGKPVFWMV